MIISVIGTHGVGKSTLMTELGKNPNYIIDDFKVSRHVQKSLGYSSLEEAINTKDKILLFQEAVLKAKYDNDIKYKEYPSNSIVFVERSFLDILLYTKTWFNKFKFNNTEYQWLWQFEKKVFYYQKLYDALILIEPHKDIPFEYDPNRGSLEIRNQFAESIKQEILASEQFSLLLQEPNLQSRISSVQQLINSL